MDKTFHFYDKISGEEFFVEAVDQDHAEAKANEYFENPTCFGEIDWDEAEALGYDTY